MNGLVASLGLPSVNHRLGEYSKPSYWEARNFRRVLWVPGVRVSIPFELREVEQALETPIASVSS